MAAVGRREEGKDLWLPYEVDHPQYWGPEDGLVKSCNVGVQGQAQCGKESTNVHILSSILGRVGMARSTETEIGVT